MFSVLRGTTFICTLTKVKVLFLVMVFVFNFDLFKFSAAILEKGLLHKHTNDDVFDDFPKISDHFPKISEDFPKLF